VKRKKYFMKLRRIRRRDENKKENIVNPDSKYSLQARFFNLDNIKLLKRLTGQEIPVERSHAYNLGRDRDQGRAPVEEIREEFMIPISEACGILGSVYKDSQMIGLAGMNQVKTGEWRRANLGFEPVVKEDGTLMTEEEI
jgi:hypothetical protein